MIVRCHVCKKKVEYRTMGEAFKDGWRGTQARGIFTKRIRITQWACKDDRP